MKKIKDISDYEFSGERLIADEAQYWEDIANSCYLVNDPDMRDVIKSSILDAEYEKDRMEKATENLIMPNDAHDVKTLVYTIIGGGRECMSTRKKEAMDMLINACSKQELIRVMAAYSESMIITANMMLAVTMNGGRMAPDSPEVIKEWEKIQGGVR